MKTVLMREEGLHGGGEWGCGGAIPNKLPRLQHGNQQLSAYLLVSLFSMLETRDHTGHTESPHWSSSFTVVAGGSETGPDRTTGFWVLACKPASEGQYTLNINR